MMMRNIIGLFLVNYSLFAQSILPPEFSVNSGFYETDFDLVLSHPDNTVQIIYTTDGSEPSLQNLIGKTYQYKKQYPELPGQLPSDFPFYTNQIVTHLYTSPIVVYDRTSEPNRISEISTTFKNNPYFPQSNLKKIFVIRSRACIANTCSEVLTQTYFVGNYNYSLPIVNINIDEDQLFGYENGLFVAGKTFDQWRLDNINEETSLWTPANFRASGSGSEIGVHFSYFDNKIEVVNQNIGMRLHGNASRILANRSYRLYAKSDYGAKEINYPFFKDYDLDVFRRIILRNSGNDASFSLFKDAFVQTLNKPLNVYIQNYQPVVNFINGEYYGILNLRERFDEKYFELKFNIKESELDFLENNGIVDVGDDVFYNFTIDFFKNSDISTPENYAKALTYIDKNNFIDYYVSQIYAENRDWPRNNNVFFRKKNNNIPLCQSVTDGRWRWLLKDMDLSFFNASNNLLRQSFPVYEEFGNDFIFEGLLNNVDFKNSFINRFADLLNSIYQPEYVVNLIDVMQNVIRPEMPNYINRWKLISSMSHWDYNIESMKNFARLRPDFQKQHILDEFNISGTYNLTVETNDTSKGFVKVNSIEINNTTPGVDEDYKSWKGQYYNNIPITLSAISLPGNAFLFWEKDGEIYSRLKELVVSPQENFGIKAIFEADIASIGDIDIVDVLIYPNPTINSLNIFSTKDVDLEYRLFTLSGQLINKGIISYNKLDVSYLPSATYLLELTHNGNKFVKKIIKK